MIEQDCRPAERFALGLCRADYAILDDVVLKFLVTLRRATSLTGARGNKPWSWRTGEVTGIQDR
jgi:hypothetical protein